MFQSVQLLALALLRPALSQGGAADLGIAAGTLALDWFYLALLPLLYLWPLPQMWALVGAGTLLLVALPWLPPRRHRGVAGAHRVTLQASTQPQTFNVRDARQFSKPGCVKAWHCPTNAAMAAAACACAACCRVRSTKAPTNPAY